MQTRSSCLIPPLANIEKSVRFSPEGCIKSPKRQGYMLLRYLDILDFRLREALNILNLESPGWEIFGLIEQSERRIAHASPYLFQWVVTACWIVWDSIPKVERIRSGLSGFC
jgi:hypothetical protein